MVALLSDCKPAILVVEKSDPGKSALGSPIEARIQHALGNRREKDTYLAWVNGHKDIKGNVEADRLSTQASRLKHDSEDVVTPTGLRAWPTRVRAEARGGSGFFFFFFQYSRAGYT